MIHQAPSVVMVAVLVNVAAAGVTAVVKVVAVGIVGSAVAVAVAAALQGSESCMRASGLTGMMNSMYSHQGRSQG